jgi:hypothetical protein
VQGSNAPAALAAAEELVRRRPLPAENLTLLAAAQAKAGDAERAGFSIKLAAQRGWRDPVVQETVLRLALAAGDKAEAARHYGALFRREENNDALLIELGPLVLGEPGGSGRSSLVGIIAGAERWHKLFLQRGARVMPADAFAEVLTAAAARGARFGCEPLKTAAEGVRQRDAVAAARIVP